MSDPAEAFERLMRLRPELWSEIHRSRDWAITITNSNDLEVFLNPEDAKGLDGCALYAMPIRQSIGVQPGQVLIFDRLSGQYIRRGEHPRAS
ncbi:hypothetical protein [Streptomyces sp. NPDC007991]|uniref:hypothetical protein n=1 Tax=Streptomyces sp. NPDC007991 TaxID=3364803 RepID=UPI0036E8B2D8